MLKEVDRVKSPRRSQALPLSIPEYWLQRMFDIILFKSVSGIFDIADSDPDFLGVSRCENVTRRTQHQSIISAH